MKIRPYVTSVVQACLGQRAMESANEWVKITTVYRGRQRLLRRLILGRNRNRLDADQLPSELQTQRDTRLAGPTLHPA